MKIDCWKWSGNEHKIHCDSYDERNAVLAIGSTRKGGHYTLPGKNREYDVIIPSESVGGAKCAIRSLRLKKAPKVSPLTRCGSTTGKTADSE